MKKVLILILLVFVFVSSSLLLHHLRGQMLVESAAQTAKMHYVLPDTPTLGKHI